MEPIALLEVAGSVLSGVFALVIGYRSVTAYRFTERPHLLNFAAGFVVLAASFFGLAVTLSVLPMSHLGEPVRATLEMFGLGLVATSYLAKERPYSRVLLGALLAAAAVGALSTYLFVPFSNNFYVGSVRLVEMALALFVSLRVVQSYTERLAPGGVYVIGGFGLLALAQYTWVIWAYVSDQGIAEVATFVRLLALIALVYGLEK